VTSNLLERAEIYELKKNITDDETWVCGYDPENKQHPSIKIPFCAISKRSALQNQSYAYFCL
jgi:hypothetical protein